MVNRTKTATTTNVGFTHEDFAKLLDKYDYHFSPGDIVAGTVFSIEPRGALIDIGAKTAAYIPIQEMSINRVDQPEEVLQNNETREFFILADENEEGQLTLSIRRIEYMRAWERVRQLQAEDATVRSRFFYQSWWRSSQNRRTTRIYPRFSHQHPQAQGRIGRRRIATQVLGSG